MFESGKKKNAAKKAYEIAYALFRISAKISEAGIKERLESQAIDLLVSANAGEYDSAAKTVAAIEALVKFSIDLNIMSIPNGEVLLREIGLMNDVVIECIDKSDEVDVAKFFTSAPQEKKRNPDSVVPVTFRPSFAPISPKNPIPINPAISSSTVFRDGGGPVLREMEKKQGSIDRPASVTTEVDAVSESGNPAIVLKSGNRQIAILDKIRQSGNCKLRELQEILPDCSERTIRYVLEELIERNLVERIGAGGPSVSYKIRQIV
jgi:hypothetical protein